MKVTALAVAEPVRINIILDVNIIGQVNNFKHFQKLEGHGGET
jgi:hypothetical protein